MPEIKRYLNRDGLEEYNSLLPHSSAEMQTYVNDWLDEHPEATTTVQDGAITEPKLADKSVSLRTLADDTVHMLKGAILTGNLSGEILTAADAYAAPPIVLTVDGKSTQVTTTGKNLFNKEGPKGYWSDTDGSFVKTNLRVWWSVPVSEGDVIRTSATGVWRSQTYLNGVFVEGNIDARQSSGYVIPSGVDEIRGSIAHNGWDTGIVTKNNSDLTYEPYTGGKPSPRPDCPQPIVSVDAPSLELHGANQWGGARMRDDFHPYAGTTVPLYDVTLRSLPDGTKDTLALTYLRPSTREGWAWYERAVERGVGIVTVSAFTSYNGRTRHGSNPGCVFGIAVDAPAVNVLGYCSHGVWVEGTTATENYAQFGSAWVTHNNPNLLKVTIAPDRSSLALGNEWLAENGPITFVYKLATPVTTTLDPIELPVLPAPTCTVWADPTTGLTMEYMRDANIVIQNIEQAIADL